MEGDDIELHYRKNKKKSRRNRCIAAIVILLVLFVVGIIIGYFIGKMHRSDKEKTSPLPPSSSSEAARREIRQNLRDVIDADRISDNSRTFSGAPHIAGSQRQKELAEELVKRWREYGFDKVEMPEHEVLLSHPEKGKRNTASVLFTNGSIAFQTTGKPKIAEKSEDHPDVVAPFLGYAPSGMVQGDLVYVNYGRIEDFQQLVDKLKVTVTGKIVIMRYGKIFRGDKVKNAETYGAIGAIIYSDPKDYAPLGINSTFPDGPFLPPTGVQRGSIFLGNGDPLTTGRPALPGVYRQLKNESNLPKIPAHPMSYGDAVHFLSKMQGNNVPDDWKGGLDITYRLGPGLKGGMKVKLDIHNQFKVTAIYNVIGTIYGKEEPDRYVLIGNHRDSWVFGAVDAVSGTSTTTEIARGLGELLKKGWRPRRTIKMCSWGGEEYGLIGSFEYVEYHAKELANKGVAYMNLDAPVSGNWVASVDGSPLLKKVTQSYQKIVEDPNAHDDKRTIYDIMTERDPGPNGLAKYGMVGSGSDFAHFYHFVGVPVVDFGYKFGYNNKSMYYPVYHTQHDTYYWMKTFVDPEFLLHKAIAQLTGSMLLDIADSPILPFSVKAYTTKLNQSFAVLKSNEYLKNHSISLEFLEKAVNEFIKAADGFAEKVDDYRDKQDELGFAKLRQINDQLLQVEKSFIYADGLYKRKNVKHVLFAPQMHNAYGVSNFPGISDAIFDAKTTGDWTEVKKQVSSVLECFLQAKLAVQPMEKEM